MAYYLAMDLSGDDVDALRLAVIRLERKLRKSVGVGDATPSQLSALFALERHGPFRIGELARREQVGNSTVTRLVATLEAKGLLERSVDEADARSSIVAITSRGRELLDTLAGGSNDYLRGRLESLGPGDRALIAGAVGALTRLAERP
ncbi:MAG: MarR family winged helix-turn-helix transcriptional regulator [Intrasporangium sp.]|uniref:MarR family winged helix-turn-helix transcriptional regulator n=1 Tax=Intrasporangium sp. TaxID=1925024 RepID=UPI003F7F10FA